MLILYGHFTVFLLLGPMRGSHLRVSRIVVMCHRVASVCVCVSLWGVLHWAYLTLSPSAPFQSHRLMWLPRYCSLGMQIKFCEEMFCCGCFQQQKYPFNHHQYSYSSTMNILHVLTHFTIWKWEFGFFMSGLVFSVHMLITVFVLFSGTNPSTILKIKSIEFRIKIFFL